MSAPPPNAASPPPRPPRERPKMSRRLPPIKEIQRSPSSMFTCVACRRRRMRTPSPLPTRRAVVIARAPTGALEPVPRTDGRERVQFVGRRTGACESWGALERTACQRPSRAAVAIALQTWEFFSLAHPTARPPHPGGSVPHPLLRHPDSLRDDSVVYARVTVMLRQIVTDAPRAPRVTRHQVNGRRGRESSAARIIRACRRRRDQGRQHQREHDGDPFHGVVTPFFDDSADTWTSQRPGHPGTAISTTTPRLASAVTVMAASSALRPKSRRKTVGRVKTAART